MRHNSGSNNNNNGFSKINGNGNNNQGLAGSSGASRYCHNVDNAFNYYKNVNLIGPSSAWGRQSSNPSPPSKDLVVRQVSRSNYKTTVSSAADTARYSDTFVKTFGGQHRDRTDPASGYVYQQIRRPDEYYNGAQYKMRPTHQQHHQQQQPALEHKQPQRQARGGAVRAVEYLNESPVYASQNSPRSPEPTWDAIL